MLPKFPASLVFPVFPGLTLLAMLPKQRASAAPQLEVSPEHVRGAGFAGGAATGSLAVCVTGGFAGTAVPVALAGVAGAAERARMFPRPYAE